MAAAHDAAHGLAECFFPVAAAMKILLFVAERVDEITGVAYVSLTDMQDATRVHPNTGFRMIADLCEAGYLGHVGRGYYWLGPQVLREMDVQPVEWMDVQG